jgi:hypothetical protein
VCPRSTAAGPTLAPAPARLTKRDTTAVDPRPTLAPVPALATATATATGIGAATAVVQSPRRHCTVEGDSVRLVMNGRSRSGDR